ncbi:hypothetical protein AX16_006810 [Volvariella volvacea WC 439]|nr:hypothetical protein AX16_006810 [Volvariella volvacea WC 439]
MSNTDSIKKGPPYALIPVPTIPPEVKDDHRETMCYEMVQAHNAFIRGINNAYEKAVRVLPKDERAFAGYCIAMTAVIHHHHSSEEEIFFPFFSTVMKMDHNVEQHEAMHGPLDAFRDYMVGVQAGTEKYDGEKARELLLAFAEPLVPHLHEEIPTVAPEILRKLDRAGMDAIIQKHQEKIKEVSITEGFCWMMGHLDLVNYPNWPPVPSFIKFIVKHFASRWYSSYWKFSPCDFSGKPQNYVGNGKTT